MADTIFERSRCCLGLLKACATTPLLRLKEDWAESQLAAFLLWTSSIGVFARGQVSADYRLQGHEDIRLLLQDLLESLQASLESLQAQAQTLPTTTTPPENHVVGTGPIEVSALEPEDPTLELAHNVETTLSYLTTLAISIRKSGTRYRDRRAEQFGKNNPDFQKIKAGTYDFLMSIRLSGIFKEHKNTTECATEEINFKGPIFERLVDCNMKRWARFLYARHHDKTLSAVPPSPHAHNIESHDADKGDTNTSQIPPETSQTISAGIGETSTLIEREATIISKLSTMATPVEREALEGTLRPVDTGISEVPIPNVAGSFVAGKLRLKYPPPPKIEASSKYFQCSCCRQLLPTEIAEQESWRKHVKSDLKPYVCLMDKCSQPLETFADTKDWLSHMDAEHRKTIVRWTCNAKHESPAVFSSEKAFIDHIKDVHPKVATKSQLPIITKRSGKPAIQMFGNCPLCGWVPDANQSQDSMVHEQGEREIKGIIEADKIRVKSKLNKHIAEHLQDIALRSLPEEIFHSGDESIRSVSSSDSSTVSMSSDLEITSREIELIRTTSINDDVQDDWQPELTSADSRYDYWGWLFPALVKIQIDRPELPNPFMCPHLENPQFIDRPKPFRELLTALRLPKRRDGPKPPTICLLTGPAGSGKTDLATKFVHRLRRHDRNISIFWVSAISYPMLVVNSSDFCAEIARVCWLPSTDKEYVRQWLSQEANGRWLIVMDIEKELDDYALYDHVTSGRLRSLVPECDHGSILLLTRSAEPILGRFTNAMPEGFVSEMEVFLEGMTESESHALMRSRISHDYDDEEITPLAANASIRLPSALIVAADNFLVSKLGTVRSVEDSSRLTQDEVTLPDRDFMFHIAGRMDGEVKSDVVSTDLPPTHRPASERWRDGESDAPVETKELFPRLASKKSKKGSDFSDSDSSSVDEPVHFFIPEERINPDVLSHFLFTYIDETSRIRPCPHPTDKTRTGFNVTARGVLNTFDLRDIVADTRDWDIESSTRAFKQQPYRYHESDTAKRRLRVGPSRTSEPNRVNVSVDTDQSYQPTLLARRTAPDRPGPEVEYYERSVPTGRPRHSDRPYEMSLPTDRPRRRDRFGMSLPTTDADGRIVGRDKPRDPNDAASRFLRAFASAEQDVASSSVDAEGQAIGDDYVLGKQIGFGGHSVVREATQLRDGNERKVAVKIVRTKIFGVSEQENERLQVELDSAAGLWRFLNHPHILPLEAIYKLDEASFFFMPLNIGGTLFDLVYANRQGIDCALAKSYSLQLASALRYLHFNARIVHCNVKLENCLIQSPSPGDPILLRLSDFGSAKRLEPQKGDSSDVSGLDFHTQTFEPILNSPAESLEYSAPELLKDRTEGKRAAVSPALDVWAYGVCVYSMIVGRRPFQHTFQPRAVMAILAGEWNRDPLARKGGDDSSELVDACLELDVTKRWSMNDVYNCTWFKGYSDTQADDSETGDRKDDGDDGGDGGVGGDNILL